tara:strand:+ start:177 stop:389 length:213 start_codon:yes stop_codon:yes gene_type:complete
MLNSIFKVNQNKKERVLRFIIGLAISIPFFTHGYTFSYILIGIGGILIFNAISGVCMIYKLFGYSSCPVD